MYICIYVCVDLNMWGSVLSPAFTLLFVWHVWAFCFSLFSSLVLNYKGLDSTVGGDQRWYG